MYANLPQQQQHATYQHHKSCLVFKWIYFNFNRKKEMQYICMQYLRTDLQFQKLCFTCICFGNKLFSVCSLHVFVVCFLHKKCLLTYVNLILSLSCDWCIIIIVQRVKKYILSKWYFLVNIRVSKSTVACTESVL